VPLAIALLAAAAAAPQPGAFRSFKDWAVACDNAKRCALASLGPADGEFPAATVGAARDAGPAGGWSLEVNAQDDAVRPAALAVDGRRFPVAPDGLAGAAAARLVAAMANGRSLAVIDRSGRTVATLSLAGAAAALRYVDAEQGRAGTVTAVVAAGPKPAAAVPAPPPLPAVTALPIAAAGGTPLSTSLLAAMRRRAGCDDDRADATVERYALGGGRTLVLLPCSSGAYNYSAALFVVANGRAVPAIADAPSGFDQAAVPQVVNAGVDGRLLTSFAKGRGLGDCGDRQSFAWDGTRLRLVEQATMGECRGNPDYLVTWRARVVAP
jgi:hypothetical protein